MSWNGVPLSKLAERRAYSGMVYNVEYVVVLVLDSNYLAGTSQGRTSRNVTIVLKFRQFSSSRS